MVSESSAPAPSWLDGLPYRLWRANQAAHRQVTAAIEDLGVTVTQLGITVHLNELGHMSASDLARLFRLTPQSTTIALNRLEKLGWVRRVPHPVHKRVIWYELTDLGLVNTDEGRRRVLAVHRRLDKLLAGPDRQALDSALSAIAASAGDETPPGTIWPVIRSGPG